MNQPISWVKSTLYDGLNKQPNLLSEINPKCVLSYIYPALGVKTDQIGLFLTQCFLECILLLYKNKSLEQNLVINLIIMFGKYHMHIRKWSNNNPNVTLFIIELEHYIEALNDLRNKKAKRI